MNKSIFDLFGLDSKSLSKSFEDFNLHDIVKNNKNISGAFDKLNDEEKIRVVDSMNKIQSSFDELFGTKSVKWTADDFKGSNVSVSTYSSEDEKNKKNDEKNVDKKSKELKPEKECDSVTFNEADDEFEDYFNESDDFDEACEKFDRDCEEFERMKCAGCDMNDCPDRVCEYTGGCSEDEYDEENELSICDKLLAELREEDTPDETDVDDIANYVLDVLNDKANKKYKLHPATKGVPAAVEVLVPSTVGKSDIVKNIHIVTMLRDVLVDTIGAYDAYISADEKSGGLVIYIPLTKV